MLMTEWKVKPMDREKLIQYKALKKEIPHIAKKLDKLYKKQAAIPVVMGKVKSSSREFPYIESHVSVQMDEPKEADRVNQRIRINEALLEKAEQDVLEIENFIAGIPDSTDRQIFELVFLQGMKYKDVGELLGYTKGRISQKISNILKD